MTDKTNSIGKPTVSVVMCTYNGEAFIREQLDSILSQTLPADEIIIQDDNSTDSTMDILTEYACRYPQIKVFHNTVNKGINPNFFSAMGRATGDYIAISDQDDIWEDYKLECQMQQIGDRLLCGGRSTPFSTTGAALRVDNRIPNISLLRQIFVGTLYGHTLLFSRKLIDKIPDLSDFITVRCYDVILTMVASACDSIVYTDRSLVRQRRYAEAATYTAPTDNTFTISNLWRTLSDTRRYNRALKPAIRERLSATRLFLQGIESVASVRKDAIRMIELYCSTSWWDYVRLTLFCFKHYDQLFFPARINAMAGRLRALYFPVSLSTYYRHLL